MKHVIRIHLKTGKCTDREKLIKQCLMGKEQYLAIGYRSIYDNGLKFESYKEYYDEYKSKYKIYPVQNVFRDAKENDLFWTRDLDGFYWICRATGPAKPYNNEELDIGAIIPVKAYKYSMQVPGQIKACFNRPLGGTSERITDRKIIEFSKLVYNVLSKTDTYFIERLGNDILSNLSDFDLEELVISYIQLKEGYYLLSNSIAKHSTTVKIECEFIRRDKNQKKQMAVVQVKGGKDTTIDAINYQEYSEKEYNVYLYAPNILNEDKIKNCIRITQEQLRTFYDEYKAILPDSITIWEELDEKHIKKNIEEN